MILLRKNQFSKYLHCNHKLQEGSGPLPSCPKPHWICDDYCDDETNIAACDWDGGDCCGDNVNTEHCTKCECKIP